ncbi:hypothetical protein A8F94_00450 [Bacillus sp. FJAT-27225]|uniref:hypothetical protein n=1 Tax=Bacillus sp. FJAT-27225 TaxID=1743144 RepID=UPI00080C3596|nr:hypothetical protein [Bacillus sp. FJAT-27225]OCA90401.1 hypothetical protein A8F94_00450 [Bacillus sp. FJAT-27225]
MTTVNNQFWQFSPIPNIEESNFNKILERFFNMRIPGLTRENTQNALDARLLGSKDPVLLTIKTGMINREEVPGIQEVIDRINCLKGRNSYTKEAIDHMQNKLNQSKVAYISFEDSNTRGLKGAKNGQTNSKEDTWAIYAYNKGVHSEEEDEAVEISRGGSHGVGKIASNAASDLNLMYFANCDAEGNQHLGGTVQLIEHMYEDQCYRSSGYFAKLDTLSGNKTKFYPFENNFHEVFEKKTRGLKIIIPFLREEYNDEKGIIKSVLDSFFVSLLEKKLEVIVNDKKITKETLREYVTNPDYYTQEIAEIKEEFTPLYVDTYLNIEPRKLNVGDGFNNYEFNLYFRYDEAIPKGRVAIVRTIGMKIEDKKIKGNVNKPYNAVLIGGAPEDAYLKSLENESHTELSYEHIKDPLLQKRAKKFINNLSKEISKIIEEAIRQNNPTDGTMNTKDILYVVENEFKRELSDITSTVKINKGKSLVKMSTNVPKKKKKSKTDSKPGDPKPKPSNPVKKVKQEKPPGDGSEQDQVRDKYIANPDIVERIILGSYEMVKFNFKDSKELSKESACNISLSIIDGMGVEYKDEFNLLENYNRVIEFSTGKECKVENNIIKNVAIRNGEARLRLDLKSTFNKALKFVYYVEV